MGFKEALKRGLFVVTTEVTAPGDEPPEQVADRLRSLACRVDGISVLRDEREEEPAPPGSPEDQAHIEGVVGDTLATCEILRDRHMDPIYRTPARLKNRPQLQDDLLAASDSGVSNLLLFTEDYRISGDSLQELMFFHVDAAKIFSVLENLRQGSDIKGRDLARKVDFCTGVGVEAGWGGLAPDMQIREMEEMVRGGADYFLTTPVFDPESLEKFVKKVRPLGIPVIAEVLILRNATMARHLNRYLRPGLVPEHVIQALASAPHRQQASIDLFVNLVRALKGVCDGVHIVPFGAQEKLHQYIDAFRRG